MSLTAKKPKRSAKIHGKQRSGRHHKHDERYLKTYWPYLPLILIVILGFTINSFWSTAHKGVLGYATDMSASELLQDTNQQRDSNSLGVLTLNSELDQAAQAKAEDMVSQDYWAHNNPQGKTPWSFILAAGYNYETAGENLAYGFDTSADTLTAWMNSPEHKANILNTTYTDVGFGIANSSDFQGTGPETIVVAEYASPASVAAAPTPSTPATTTTTPAQSSPAPVTAALPTSSTPASPTSTPTPTPSVTTHKPAVVSSTPETSKATGVTVKAPASQSISRIQLLAASRETPWSAFAVSTIAIVCLAVFLLRHGLIWHRYLRKGEQFIMNHKLLDVALIAIGVIGILLTQTAGVIR